MISKINSKYEWNDIYDYTRFLESKINELIIHVNTMESKQASSVDNNIIPQEMVIVENS